MMGGDESFPWLILLRRQFLIKLIMPLRGGSKREAGVGERALEGLALEKGGDGWELWSQSLRFQGAACDWQGLKEWDLACLCPPHGEASGESSPKASSPPGCREHPPGPVSV